MLYRRYARIMFSFCLIYESERDRAKDILQEAFIKIFRNISGYHKSGSLTGWMKKIIINTAIDHFRKKTSGIRFIQIEEMDHPVADEESVEASLNEQDIISQIRRLPEGARIIFQLHALEGYSHSEIAHLLHISVGTSKSQICRAKHLLQKWMKENDKLKCEPIEG